MNNYRLESTEITNLFIQYIMDTASICVSKHVLATVKDSEVCSLFEFSLEVSEKHVKKLKDFFHEENFPIPDGFKEKDVNLEAPPLFVDSFWLYYQHTMSHIGLSSYALSFGNTVRQDMQDYYYQCNVDAMEVYKKCVAALLSKGLYENSPYYSTPSETKYVKNLGYALDVIGKKRPLNSAEAGNIFFNLTKTRLAKGVSLGFSQVTKNKDLRKYLETNIRDINKNYGLFSSLLQEENLNVPILLDTNVTNSTVAPFSDKLMAVITGFLTQSAISYYGTALGSSMRIDLIGHCETAILGLLKQLTKFGSVALNNGWIEKLPEANDRKELPIN
ncbi:DUF3231 family protein [Paenibacillus sp. BSR1-1]|uniref:DUF3231 family protein n=1 Tax=Paenibacillus sp. BSR1-1 TaxID=3020845 RepID=UPI0025B1332B|nr:DUF3231 family protein [Paenibacillus sp. BSR1-1]MDN3018885.1 DUF3231 family protein [Paenibacillus sp. BSR1-1]